MIHISIRTRKSRYITIRFSEAIPTSSDVQMKYTKHIRRVFNSVTLVMPQGWDFEALGVPRGGGQIFFFLSGISNRRGWRAKQNASKIFILGSNWWPWGEIKRSNFIQFRLTCLFQRFLYQTLCVLYKWKIQNLSDRFFILSPWSCPRGGTLGRWVAQGGQRFFFKKWSCGISNRLGWRAEHFHPRVKLVILGWGQKVKYH